MGFLDIRPVFKGHTLLAPRQHVDTLVDLPATLRDPLLAATQRVADAVESALGAEGSFVAVNNKVSQSVPHLHVHVVPRWAGDTNFMPVIGEAKVLPESLDATYRKLRRAFADAAGESQENEER